MAHSEGPARSTFLSIQYLRAVAALLVVVHHARNEFDWLYNPLADYNAFAWGVDIFFVISGFIMGIAASREAPVEFAKKRVIRIVPLYWVATLAAVVITERAGVLSIGGDTIADVMKSFFFIPHGDSAESGRYYPYLVPGWTLNYEMFFYVIFFLGLIARRPIVITASIIPLLVVLGLAVDPSGPAGVTYTDPIMLEFLLGHLLAIAWQKGWIRHHTIAGLLLLPLGFAGLFSTAALDESGQMAGRIASATVIVLGALAVDAVVPEWRLGKLLGDASYSIYLTHTVISLWIVTRVMSRLPLGETPLQFGIMVVASLTVSAVMGVLVYRYVERPMLRVLRTWLLPRKVAPPHEEAAGAIPR